MSKVTDAILSRAKRDPKFREELIDKLEDKAKEAKQHLVTLEKTIRVVKRLSK